MCVLEQRGISSRAIERWTVKGSVGFIPALKREAFSSILRKCCYSAHTERSRSPLAPVYRSEIACGPPSGIQPAPHVGWLRFGHHCFHFGTVREVPCVPVVQWVSHSVPNHHVAEGLSLSPLVTSSRCVTAGPSCGWISLVCGVCCC